MFRNHFFTFVLTLSFLLLGSIAVAAQNAPVAGRVMLEKADRSKEPIAGAVVEAFRTDIKGKGPMDKTNKKGEFAFAGLQLGSTFVLSISAPNAKPGFIPNVRPGQGDSDKLVITLQEGDGKRWTEEEIRQALAQAPTSAGTPRQPTEDEKKAQAEMEKKNAEIMAKNKRLEETDQIAKRTNEEGWAALKANNYELAITKFNEGVAAVPDFVGSTPILLDGKLQALRGRGFGSYREGAASSDVTVKLAKYELAKKDYNEALAAYEQAMTVVKNAPATTDAAEQKRRESTKTALMWDAMETHRLMAAGNVDISKADAAAVIFNEYLAVETDPVKKTTAQITLGDIMRLTGNFEKAVAAYRKVLETSPDNPEAMAGLGLSLFAQGAAAVPEDKEKMQEGLNHMQRYTEIAPVSPTDTQQIKELKTSVKETVEYLKTQQKLTPQKVTSTKKKN